MTEAEALRERTPFRPLAAEPTLAVARETAGAFRARRRGAAKAPGCAGSPPNFSGAETDARLVDLWLGDKGSGDQAPVRPGPREVLLTSCSSSSGRPMSSRPSSPRTR